MRARAWSLILLACIVPGRAVGSPLHAGAPDQGSVRVLTSLGAIRALSQDEGARGYPVRVRGIVTHFDEGADVTLFIHDGELGQFVVPPLAEAAVAVWKALRRGDLVEIEGRTVRGGFAPNVEPSTIRRVGRMRLPPPETLPFSAMLSGRHDCDYVEVTGIVQRAWRSSEPQSHTLFMEVAIEDGIVRAAFWDFTAEDVGRFVDARVRLHGNVGAIFGRTEQLRGVSLLAGRTRDITVLEPAPDPFGSPARSIRSIYKYSARGEVNRRIRIRGTVTGFIAGRPVEVSDFTTATTFRYVRHVLYVADATGAARVETEEGGPAAPGTVVEVAGFPAVSPGKPVLKNAVFRVAGEAPQPAALSVTGAAVLSADHDATLVRMEARFLSMLHTASERILVLQAGESVFDATLADEPSATVLERLRPGTLVSVTGVYSYEWGPPPAFRLFLRSIDDVRVLAAPPWWTLRHTAVMVGIFALAASGTGVWARAAVRRKRQQYLAVLNERSRVARELHDTLEQGLAGIALQLEAVAGSLHASPDRVQQALQVARQMLRYSQEEARRSVMDLRAQALENRDLADALADLAQQMTHAAGATAHVDVDGPRRRLDASDEHHLLRIGLEALTNALKHARASRIDILLRFAPDSVELVVQDDGCGLPALVAEPPGGHFGLMGIRERTDKMGGLLRLEAAPGGGTRLAVTVPSRRTALADTLTRVLREHGGHAQIDARR